MATVLKTVGGKTSVGSNPTPSSNFNSMHPTDLYRNSLAAGHEVLALVSLVRIQLPVPIKYKRYYERYYELFR